MTNNNVQEILARSRSLLNGLEAIPKTVRTFPKRKNRQEQDIYIWQNKPVGGHDWKKEKNIIFVNIYFPTHIPIDLTAFSIVFHNHTIFEPCLRQRYCHKMGYKPNETIAGDFYKVWGELYPDEDRLITKVLSYGVVTERRNVQGKFIDLGMK